MFKNNKYGLFMALLGCVVLISACALTDGKSANDDDYGYYTCSSDNDCDSDSYCNPAGFCATDCRSGKDEDCAIFGSTDYECVNSRCLMPCKTDGTCKEGKCDTEGIYGDAGQYCIFECATTQDCTRYGKDLVCEDSECISKDGIVDGDLEEAQEEEEEVAAETIGIQCHYRTAEECSEYHWHADCKHDPCWKEGYMNECREDGECINTGTVDLGTIDDTKNASKYVGVWAEILTTAATTIGLPAINKQSTVTAHHNLVRIKQEGDKLIMQHKACQMIMYNFTTSAIENTSDSLTGGISIPKTYWENVAVLEHTVDTVPEFKAGSKFDTDFVTEVRGVKLGDDWEKGTIPNRDQWLAEEANESPKTVWDQDYDDKPGMTTNMIGMFSGKVYSTQRWGCALHLNVVNESRMEGVISHGNEQYQIHAEPDDLIQKDTQSFAYETDDTRSYSRMQKLTEDATCEDVLALLKDCPALTSRDPLTDSQYLCFSVHVDGSNDPADVETSEE